ncbi:MAG: hypothetical protein V4695_06355 [Pseudomonadota bacterium]
MTTPIRKIIHCDCDCFYAAVEMRDKQHFGKFGVRLHELVRGIDHRPVCAVRERKSISV